MAQNKIAIDVVLLPSLNMIDKAIQINKEILNKSENPIKLNTSDCLPHITLAMGCIEKNNVSKIDKILKNLSDEFEVFRLKTISSMEKKAWLRIAFNKDLQLLHEALMNKSKEYFTYNATEDMIYRKKDEVISDITLDYIKNFSLESSFENYTPHITVGSGLFDIETPEVKFMSQEIALCHLGNYCTCRKVLFSHKLLSRK